MNLVKIIILFSIFFVEQRVFGIPMPIGLFFLMVLNVIVFQKTSIINSLKSRNNIRKILFLIVTSVIITYIIKYGNNEQIKQVYFYKTGVKPDFLYFKIALNGIIYLFTAILTFSIGLSYNANAKLIDRSINFIGNMLTINAVIIIIAWVLQTKGVIGRYNFNPVFNTSFGVNIQLSIIGFMLILPRIKSFRSMDLPTFQLLILALSILIIISRQNQIKFLIMVLIYLQITVKNVKRYRIPLFILILISTIIYLGINGIQSDIFDSYSAMADSQGDDVQSRYVTFTSAIDIFKNNIIFGIGYGMFGGYSTTILYLFGTQTYLSSPHNGFAAILSEMGLVGFILAFSLCFQIIKGFLRIIKSRSKDYHYKLVVSIFSLVLVNIVFLLSSNFFLLPPPSEYSYYGIASISWLLIGMVMSLEIKRNEK